MSQTPQHRHSDGPRTLHGFEREAEPPPGGGWGESTFVPIGRRVGPSGQVFETDGGAGRGDLVVKLFTWGADLPAQVVRDFTRDVTTVANLHHPHVAQVVNVGTLGDGTPFVVMERLGGMTLEEATGGRPVPFAELLPILRGVASALAAAHSAGVAHGNVGPDNIFIAQDGYGQRIAKLLDFGVARLAGGARPELELGGRAGERADQLALATLAWRLSGALAPAVEHVLSRAMSPDPSQRFGTIVSFIESLERAFASPATGGWTNHAASVTTLIGSDIPGSVPASVGPRLAGAPPRLPAFSPRPSGAPPSGIASPPSSLTQQFFAEGERLEKANAAGPTREAETGADERDESDESGERDELEIAAVHVPRSRAQMILAALFALGSVAVIAWTVVSLASKTESASPIAELQPRTADARPAATAAPGARARGRAFERQQQESAVGRPPRVRARSSAAPAAAPLTAAPARAPSGSAAPTQPSAAPPIESPAPPPVESRPAEAAPTAGPSGDSAPKQADEAAGEPAQAAPTPEAPDETAAPESRDTPPPASAPDPSSASAPAAPDAPQ
jgi:hypothetical protein